MSNIQIDTTELDRIAAGLRKNRTQILEALAFEIEREAKNNAPYQTGTLSASIHTVTEGGNSLQSFDNKSGAEVEELPSPSGNVVAVVGTGVEYAAYVELGTSRMAAQPYLGPAVEDKAGKINDGSFWRELFE
jgi:HK97 gp10 family phage protein